MKKLKILAAVCTLVVLPFTVNAEESGQIMAGENPLKQYVQDAAASVQRGVEVNFIYHPDQVYKVYLQTGFVTDICLAPGETVKYIGGGDTERWKIDMGTSGNNQQQLTHIFIKPTQKDISTNLIINTNLRSYQLNLVSTNRYNPIISWRYPKSDLDVLNEQKVKSYSTINPSKMNFHYRISNKKYDWAPVMVFDSGEKTYIKMKDAIGNSELPVFFIIDDEGKMVLSSYRYLKGYIIVDRLFDKAVLLLGKKKIKIECTHR